MGFSCLALLSGLCLGANTAQEAAERAREVAPEQGAKVRVLPPVIAVSKPAPVTLLDDALNVAREVLGCTGRHEAAHLVVNGVAVVHSEYRRPGLAWGVFALALRELLCRRVVRVGSAAYLDAVAVGFEDGICRVLYSVLRLACLDKAPELGAKIVDVAHGGGG